MNEVPSVAEERFVLPQENWVPELLQSAVRNDWCVRIGCNTCGATEFCGEIERHLNAGGCSAPGLHSSPLFRRGRDRTIDISLLVDGLVELKPASFSDGASCNSASFQYKWREALQGLLVWAWYAQDGDAARKRMRESLSDTFAGSVLENMILSYEAQRAQQAMRQSENPPERRKKRLVERQAAHQARLMQKSIRDAEMVELAIARFGLGIPRPELFRRLFASVLIAGSD